MKAGRVVIVRIHPDDCMGVIDVIQATGSVMRGMSFAQAVSLALHQLLNGARAEKLIPNRDGFEYNEMMQPFADQPSIAKRTRKLAITSLYEQARMREEPAESPFSAAEGRQKTMREIELESRLKELAAKIMMDDEGINTESYQQESLQLQQELLHIQNNKS